MYFRIRNKRGITLIALVITIIILLILAGISISSLIGSGLLGNAKDAKKAQIKSEMKERLMLAIQELQIEKSGDATLNDITSDWINEKLKEYENKIIETFDQDSELTNSKKIKMKKSGVTQRFIIDLNLNIIEMDYDGSVELSYMEKERNGNNVKISIYVQDEENGIEKIELPNIEPYIGNGTKEEISLDYEIEVGKEYKIVITPKNGEKVEKTISIKQYATVTMNLGEGIDIDNKSTKIIYNQPYTAKMIEKGDYILDDFVVTMNGTTVSVDNMVGTINIEKVTGDIEITATSKKVSNLINIKEAYKLYIRDKYNLNTVSEIQELLFNGNINERW